MRSYALVVSLLAAASLAQPAVLDRRDVIIVTETAVTFETVWVEPNGAPATATPVPSPTPVDEISSSSTTATATETPEPVAVPAAPAAAARVVPAPAALAADSTNGNSFEAVCLKQHNILRAKHNAPPLSWSNDLAASSEALAKQCVFRHDV